MAGTSSRLKPGARSRRNRALKVALVLVAGIAVLLALNVFALNSETGSAGVNVTNGQLINTTSGQIQVVDTPDPGAVGGFRLTPPVGRPAALPQAPPIVLIHGSGGAIDWWDEAAPLLVEQGRRVIAIDMLGYGGSDKPASGYSIESQAGLIAQALSRLDVKEAAVVGHSLGGQVASALAGSSPDLVAGVAVIDTAPDSSFGGLSGTATAARLPVVGPALWRIAPDFMVRRNLEQAFAPNFEVPDKFIDDVRAMNYPAYRDSARESDKYLDAEPLNVRLQDTGLPLLVIFGEQDRLYPAREALSAYAAIPGVETVLIPEAGHSPNVETPEKVAVALGGFVNTLAPEPKVVPMPAAGRPGAANRPGAKKNRKNGGQNERSPATGGAQPGA